MPDPIVMIKAAILAAVVAAIVAALLGRSRLAGGAPGLGLAILAGAWALGLAPKVPPSEALDRVLVVLLPLAIIAEIVGETLPKVIWPSRLAVAALATPVLLRGSSYVADLAGPGSREWGVGQTATVYAGLAASLFLAQATYGLLASRAPRSTVASLAVASGGAGIVMMLSGYATGGQLGVPLAAGLGALVFFGDRHASGAVAVAVVALFGLLVVGRLFAGLTTLNAALILAAPALGWLPELPKLRRLGPRTRATLRAALPILPVVLALVLAQQKFVADSASQGSASGEPGLNDYLDFGK